MDPIDVSFEISEDEYVEGQLGQYRKARKLPVRSSAPIAIVPVIVIVGLAIGHHLATAYGLFLVAVSVALLAVTPFLLRLQYKMAVRKAERAVRATFAKLECKNQRFIFDEDSWQNTCICGTDTRFWSAVKAVEDFPTILILRMRNRSGYVLPKRIFTPEQMTAFNDLLQRRVTNRPK